MKQKIVGTYKIGGEYCELVLRDGDGGEFYSLPEHGHVPRIKVGADYQDWDRIVSVLLHETMEFSLARIKCRFYPEDDFGGDTHAYIFIMSHPDFSDACARTAEFMTCALPDLARAWKKWKS